MGEVVSALNLEQWEPDECSCRAHAAQAERLATSCAVRHAEVWMCKQCTPMNLQCPECAMVAGRDALSARCSHAQAIR